uniref:Uncharacterized protein n=1 Tax=Mycena chlorophos TaxID=658473 RepID=A0ABQ0MCP2_MYCCL|nr:predicted protein [Mycena chlorophos]
MTHSATLLCCCNGLKEKVHRDLCPIDHVDVAVASSLLYPGSDNLDVGLRQAAHLRICASKGNDGPSEVDADNVDEEGQAALEVDGHLNPPQRVARQSGPPQLDREHLSMDLIP